MLDSALGLEIWKDEGGKHRVVFLLPKRRVENWK